MPPERPTVPTFYPPLNKLRGIPSPVQGDDQSIYNSLAACIEVVEFLVGVRGRNARAVTLEDLERDGGLGPVDNVMEPYLLADRHLSVDPITNNPHRQYWHKGRDTAGGAMSISSDKALNSGDTLAPWDMFTVDPYNVGGNLTNGAFLVDGTVRSNGIYLMALYLDLTGGNRALHTFDFYVNGVPTGNPFRLLFGNQQTDGMVTWVGLVTINSSAPAEVTVRNVSASAPFTVVSADWSMFRVAPMAGTATDSFSIASGINLRGHFSV